MTSVKMNSRSRAQPAAAWPAARSRTRLPARKQAIVALYQSGALPRKCSTSGESERLSLPGKLHAHVEATLSWPLETSIEGGEIELQRGQVLDGEGQRLDSAQRGDGFQVTVAALAGEDALGLAQRVA